MADKPETKKALQARLENLGWWADAKLIREKARKDAQVANPAITTQEAADIGWQAMRDAYPIGCKQKNLPGAQTSVAIDAAVANKEAEIKQATSSKPPSSKKEDFEWVYQNIADGAAVDYSTCPGDGARGLLEWARSRKDKFYDLFLAKFINKTDDAGNRRSDGPTDLIDELLSQRAQGLRGELALSPLVADEGGRRQERAGSTVDSMQ